MSYRKAGDIPCSPYVTQAVACPIALAVGKYIGCVLPALLHKLIGNTDGDSVIDIDEGYLGTLCGPKKGCAYIVKRGKVIGVVKLDRGDNLMRRIKAQKRVLILAGLGKENLTPAVDV